MRKSRTDGFSGNLIVSLAARSAALTILFMQAGLHLRDFADVRWLGVACMAAALAGALAALAGFRTLPALALSAILPFAFRAVFLFCLSLVSGPGINPDIDSVFLDFDANFAPFWPAFTYCAFASFMFLRFPKFREAEPLANAFLLAAAFASQAQYRITLYPHPVVLAVVISLFLALEAVALYFLARSSRPGAAQKPWPLLFAVLPLALLIMFFLLNRYSEGAVRQGGGLIKPTLFKFDFSDYLSLESEISLGNDLVLLVKKDPENPAYLLRRYVLNAWSPGRGFHREKIDGVSEHPDATPSSRTEWPNPGYKARLKLEQEYYIVNFDSRAFIAMNVPLRAIPFEIPQGSGFQSVYKVTSEVPALASPMTLESSGNAPVEGEPFPWSGEITEMSYKTLTDYGKDEKLKDLALEVTDGISGWYDRVLAVNDFLKNGYRYSLKPGVAPDGNQLGHFLFTSKKGYCSYFAFSMALMLRSIGIPSRVAVGFFLSPDTEILGVHPVRANMAHAWVEVWFPEAGWMEFDPTSETMADGEDQPSPGEDDSEKLMRLIQELFSARGTLVEASGTDLNGLSGNGTGNGIFDSAVNFFLARWYWLIASAIAFILAFPHAAYALALLFTRDPRRLAVLRFGRLESRLAALGMPRRFGESRSEWAARLESDSGLDAGNAERIYARAMWAEDFKPSDLEKFRDAAHVLLKAARHKAGLARTLASFLIPRPPARKAR